MVHLNSSDKFNHIDLRMWFFCGVGRAGAFRTARTFRHSSLHDADAH